MKKQCHRLTSILNLGTERRAKFYSMIILCLKQMQSLKICITELPLIGVADDSTLKRALEAHFIAHKRNAFRLAQTACKATIVKVPPPEIRK
jgi:hypothetical protein